MTGYFLSVSLIVFVASFVQSFSGFGFALISIPLLSFFYPLKIAIPLGALFGLLLNSLMFIKLKKEIAFKELKPLYFGAVIGIPIGAYLLRVVETQTLKYFLSGIIFLFLLNSTIKFYRGANVNERWGYIAGFFSGIFGGAINTNGPPVLIYFQIKTFDKNKFKGAITGFFIVTSILIVSSHIISGVTDYFVLKNFIYFFPFVFIGFYLGNFLFDKINTVVFNKLVLVFLLIIAIILII